MEIQNEIVKTKKRIQVLCEQNSNFKKLLDKAFTLTQNVSNISENEFIQESLQVIESEKENIRQDLKILSSENTQDGDNTSQKIHNLEKLINIQDKEIEVLKSEHSEIKFLLLHPESRDAEWLKYILNFQHINPKEQYISDTRFRLRRKIFNLEKKKAELLIAIRNAQVPENFESLKKDTGNEISATLDNSEIIRLYEDLRYQMLNLEDERFRLLQELQYVLECSKKEIAEEYTTLQAKIIDIEKQRAKHEITPAEVAKEDISQKELQNILGAFSNVPYTEIEEDARVIRVQARECMFCPKIQQLPLYCTIL